MHVGPIEYVASVRGTLTNQSHFLHDVLGYGGGVFSGALWSVDWVLMVVRCLSAMSGNIGNRTDIVVYWKIGRTLDLGDRNPSLRRLAKDMGISVKLNIFPAQHTNGFYFAVPLAFRCDLRFCRHGC